MFEVEQWTIFSFLLSVCLFPLSLPFCVALVLHYVLLYSTKHCPTDFLFFSSLSLVCSHCSLSDYLSLIGCFTSSKGYCIAVHILYRLCRSNSNSWRMLSVDAKEQRNMKRKREIESILHYSNICICSFPYHHFVLLFFLFLSRFFFVILMA